MNSIQLAQRQWFDDIVARNASLIPDSLPWLNKTRSDARHAISECILPHRKLEAWRYSDLGKLFKQRYRYDGYSTWSLKGIDIDNWIYSEAESHRLVFVNGRFIDDMSIIHELPGTIKIGSLQHMLSSEPGLVSRWLQQKAQEVTDVFTELNLALINDGVFIHVPAHEVVDRPIEIVYLNTSHAQNTLSQPHSLVILEAGARARVVERFVGADASTYFFNGVTRIWLGASANLQHYRLQNESSNAYHLGRVVLRQHTASEYSGFSIATGGVWSRTDISARFAGQHAVCNLDGLYTVGEQQYTDFHLDVVHALPHCTSRENFKGIVYGKGRAVFDGRILVEKDAQKTDAQLTNKNLLLTQNAEVDTKPQLEINADDVKCSHGTTVGKLDPNQLFYLRSRGIDEQEARKMICLGFADQALAQVSDERARDFIRQQIAGIFSQQGSYHE
ncbi:MAG: Fe-S cluster assembly protein SufD [Gammaproteobacteria bacterium]|nr:Fe-S cluster assembly protein SufD [Gammaproteobacteria bacterium]